MSESIFFDAPAFTVVGTLNGQPFVQSFRCPTATDAALAAGSCGLSIDRGDLIAVFPGVQIPDESWRPQAEPESARPTPDQAMDYTRYGKIPKGFAERNGKLVPEQ